MEIPTLDVQCFVTGTPTQRALFATKVVNSFVRTGFVKVVNHGISDQMVDELFEWNKRFFAMSTEAKSMTTHPPSRNKPQRGWSSVGVEATGYLRGAKGSDLLDKKEHFDQGSSDDTSFPNRWPKESDLPGFRQFMESYYDTIYAFSIQMLSVLEVGLHLPPGSFSSRCSPGASDLRLNHYPAITVRELNNGSVSRIWPHTDFGLITPLFQDGIGGLEIEDRNNPNTFLPVIRDSPYEMVLNVSDTLERWTNGFMKSGVHRVSTPIYLKDKNEQVISERYSVAYFFKADRGQSVGPLAQFIKEGEKPKFDDITALEFQKRRTQTMFMED